MQLRKMFKNTRGDTLVEVMISIAIVGLAVTIAYSLATRSLQTGVLATERTQANKIAESQVEALKFRQRASFPSVWATNFGIDVTNFCLDVSSLGQLDAGGAVKNDWKPLINTGNPEDLAVNTTGPGYNPICTDSTQKYFVNVTSHNANDGTGTVYQIMVRWESLQSTTPNQSQIYYKLPDQLQVTSPSTPPVSCVPKILDLALLLDASSSMQENNIAYEGEAKSLWDVLKIVVEGFISGANDINITPAGNHLGLVTFSALSGPNGARLEFPISSDIAGLEAAANAMTIKDPTYVVPGLDIVNTQLLSARPTAQKVMILITDGTFNDNKALITSRIQVMKDAGVKIFTIGIGLNDEPVSTRNFLSGLATSSSYYANVESGDDLQSILNQISDILTCD
jgi:prepilin-type N-terminal cleavage/methylation domain-containing protein